MDWNYARANMPSPMGWSKRRAAAIAAAEERADELSEDKAKAALRALVLHRDKLAAVVTTLEDRVRELRAKLAADEAQLAVAHHNTQLTGDVTAEAMRLRTQVRTLPEVIGTAEAALTTARDALAGHEAAMAPRLNPVPEAPAAPATTKKARRS